MPPPFGRAALGKGLDMFDCRIKRKPTQAEMGTLFSDADTELEAYNPSLDAAARLASFRKSVFDMVMQTREALRRQSAKLS